MALARQDPVVGEVVGGVDVVLGENHLPLDGLGGAGGAGICSSITGQRVFYGGGGGGYLAFSGKPVVTGIQYTVQVGAGGAKFYSSFGGTAPSGSNSGIFVAATGASLYVPGVLGDGAIFTPTVDRVGSITSISITDAGEDYISAPNISLKVQDLLVTNVPPTSLPSAGDMIYQGANYDFWTTKYERYSR